MATPAKVRLLDVAADLPAVAALLESEVPAFGGVRKSAAEHLKHLQWLLLENPERGEFPAGWVLESSGGAILGVHLNVPRMFCGPAGTVPVFFSCYFFVKEEARGMESLGLFLSYRKLAAQGILMASSANVNSAPLWHKLGGTAIPGTGEEWMKPGRLLPLAEEALHRRTGWKWKLTSVASREASAPGNGFAWLRARGDIAAAATPPPTQGWEPVRSAEWLQWMFDSGEGGPRLYRWDGVGGPVFLAVSWAHRGWRGQIRCLQITDCWSAGGEIPGRLLLENLWAAHRKDADALCVRGAGELPAAAATLGWRRRDLVAPALWMGAAHAEKAAEIRRFYPGSGA